MSSPFISVSFSDVRTGTRIGNRRLVVHLRRDAHLVVLFLDGQAARGVADAAQASALAAFPGDHVVILSGHRFDDDVVGVVAFEP